MNLLGLDPIWRALLVNVLWLLRVYDPAGALVVEQAGLENFSPKTPIYSTYSGVRIPGVAWVGADKAWVWIDPYYLNPTGTSREREVTEAAIFTHEARHVVNTSTNEVAPRLQAYITAMRLRAPEHLKAGYWGLVTNVGSCPTWISDSEIWWMWRVACLDREGDVVGAWAAYIHLPQRLHWKWPRRMYLNGGGGW